MDKQLTKISHKLMKAIILDIAQERGYDLTAKDYKFIADEFKKQWKLKYANN